MLIDTENPSTYPSAMQETVYQYIADNLSHIEAQVKENIVENDSDVRCAIENYLSPFKAESLYAQLLKNMAEHEMICYHATKALDQKQIMKSGLRASKWSLYSVSLRKTLEVLGAEDVDSIIDCVHKEYERKHQPVNYKPQLCFFSGLNFADGGDYAGYDQFCQNIGGELARWALKDTMPKAYYLLKNNGIQLIVKFILPFADIAAYQQETILYQFVCYYAAQYFWGWKYTVQFEGRTSKDISPEQILELIEYDKEVDYE